MSSTSSKLHLQSGHSPWSALTMSLLVCQYDKPITSSSSIPASQHAFSVSLVHIPNYMHSRHSFWLMVDPVWAFKHLPLPHLLYLMELWSILCILVDKFHLPVRVSLCNLHPVVHLCGISWWLHLYSVGVIMFSNLTTYWWLVHPSPLALMWFL